MNTQFKKSWHVIIKHVSFLPSKGDLYMVKDVKIVKIEF